MDIIRFPLGARRVTKYYLVAVQRRRLPTHPMHKTVADDLRTPFSSPSLAALTHRTSRNGRENSLSTACLYVNLVRVIFPCEKKHLTIVGGKQQKQLYTVACKQQPQQQQQQQL